MFEWFAWIASNLRFANFQCPETRFANKGFISGTLKRLPRIGPSKHREDGRRVSHTRDPTGDTELSCVSSPVRADAVACLVLMITVQHQRFRHLAVISGEDARLQLGVPRPRNCNSLHFQIAHCKSQLSRKGFCRNPRGIYFEQSPGWILWGIFWWIFFGPFLLWKNRREKNPPKNPWQNSNQNWKLRSQNPHCKDLALSN